MFCKIFLQLWKEIKIRHCQIGTRKHIKWSTALQPELGYLQLFPPFVREQALSWRSRRCSMWGQTLWSSCFQLSHCSTVPLTVTVVVLAVLNFVSPPPLTSQKTVSMTLLADVAVLNFFSAGDPLWRNPIECLMFSASKLWTQLSFSVTTLFTFIGQHKQLANVYLLLCRWEFVAPTGHKFWFPTSAIIACTIRVKCSFHLLDPADKHGDIPVHKRNFILCWISIGVTLLQVGTLSQHAISSVLTYSRYNPPYLRPQFRAL